jgi:hypothetical protein
MKSGRDFYKKGDRANCTRCFHDWKARKDGEIMCCPKCGSPYWDRERGERYTR